MRAAAGTIQSPFIGESFRQRLQERSVTIRAAAKQISDMAFGTLDAVTNTGRHGTIKCKDRYCLLTVPQSPTVAEFADENEASKTAPPLLSFQVLTISKPSPRIAENFQIRILGLTDRSIVFGLSGIRGALPTIAK
jgi:hypothetical protein